MMRDSGFGMGDKGLGIRMGWRLWDLGLGLGFRDWAFLGKRR